MKKLLPIALFATLLLAAGVVHGIRTERWAATQELGEATQRLAGVPLEFADWRGEHLPVEESDLRRAGIRGHVFNRYRNVRTGASFNVLLVCGRTGPISVHTPDVCYEGAGFKASMSPEDRPLRINESEVLTLKKQRFNKPNSLSASQLEVCWVWRGGDRWAATDNPRIMFAEHPVLYKMYVIREVSPRQKESKSDPLADFMKDFLPEVNKTLSPK